MKVVVTRSQQKSGGKKLSLLFTVLTPSHKPPVVVVGCELVQSQMFILLKCTSHGINTFIVFCSKHGIRVLICENKHKTYCFLFAAQPALTSSILKKTHVVSSTSKCLFSGCHHNSSTCNGVSPYSFQISNVDVDVLDAEGVRNLKSLVLAGNCSPVNGVKPNLH